MKPYRTWIFTLALSLFGSSRMSAQSNQADDLTHFVDPRIGVLGEGSCVIGPTLPFGSVNPSPDTPDGGEDGYHPDRPIRGFSQTHVSGTGYGYYGNILISPQVGLDVSETGHDSPKSDEKASPYEYRVKLDRYGVLTEISPTARAVFYQFTFPKSEESTIAIDAAHMIPGDISTRIKSSVTDGSVNISEDGRSMSGYGSYRGGFGSGIYRVYFYAEINRSPTSVGTWKNGQISAGSKNVKLQNAEDRVGGFTRYRTVAGDVVKMKVGISFRSTEAAHDSLLQEIPAWDYAKTREAARKTWQNALAGFQIEEKDETQKAIFYTAVYHAFVMPRDRTGEFERFKKEAPMWDDHYAVWDTWRTLYPLMLWIRPDMVRGTIQSFIERQRVDKLVVDTFIAGINRSGEQGGNDVDNIIADAYSKKLTGVDWKAAYGVMKWNADQRRTAYPDKIAPQDRYKESYLKTGWIPTSVMSASHTLEFAYNDFCTAEVAAGLGLKSDAEKYLSRSRKWEALWNPEAESDGFKGFVVPKKENGEWPEHDLKAYGGSWKGDFYEGNSWTYSYFVPHQPARLVELMGGQEMFANRLDYGMTNNVIGFGNEPAFLAPQLFHYAGRPDLAAKWVRKVTGSKFSTKGYPGDDDSGAMSSYFIWVKMGLFPNAGQDLYYITGPVFERMVVRRPEDGSLEINRTGKGDFIASVKLNEKTLNRSWLRDSELKGKAKLDFVMSETPTSWGQKELPPTVSP